MSLPKLFVMWVGEGAREGVSEGAAAVGVDTAEERGVDDRVPRRAQIRVVPLHSQHWLYKISRRRFRFGLGFYPTNIKEVPLSKI